MMSAAQHASDETVSSLLSWGADPDKTDAKGDPALIFAIESKCSTTINLLAPKTKANLGGALYNLARFKVDLMTGELRQLVERAAQDREAAIEGILAVAIFGSSAMIPAIAQQVTIQSLKATNKRFGLQQSIQTASQQSPPSPLPATSPLGEEEREALKGDLLDNTA